MGPVAEGVDRDLRALTADLPGDSSAGLAALARELAAMVDDDMNAATARAACAKELRTVLATLRAMVPVDEDADELDQLKQR